MATAKRKTKPAVVTSGQTTRTGTTKSGGQYILMIQIDGVEINGKPVEGQAVVDAIADGFEASLKRAERGKRK